MEWIYDDGGRAAAGFRGHTGDCVARSIAIATEVPYRKVYDGLNELAAFERPRRRRRSNSRLGVQPVTYRRWLQQAGWAWTPTMGIGTGCRVHLVEGELPEVPRLVVRLSKHLTAVVDGVIHDTHDPSRAGSRCVYGWWSPAPIPGIG